MGRLIKVTQIDLSGIAEIHMVRNAQQISAPPHIANQVRLHTNAQYYSEVQNESNYLSHDRRRLDDPLSHESLHLKETTTSPNLGEKYRASRTLKLYRYSTLQATYNALK